MPTRRQFLAALGAAPAVLAQPKRPNFVVLLTDDQRFDTIRALGHPEVSTPNMDRLVARGVTFTQAGTQGGLHGAICMPSRVQLLTGRNVFQAHKQVVDHQQTPDPAAVTCFEHLRAQGYATFHTGKWHNGEILFQRSFGAGEEIFFGGMSDQMKVKVFDYQADGRYTDDRSRISTRFSSEMFGDAAIRFLQGRDKSKPYALYTAFTSPHDPRMAPERFARMYDADKVSLPPNFLPQHPFDNGEMRVRDEMLAPFPRTPEEVRKHIAGYYAMVSEVDSHIGRVLDEVDRSGDPANTYIVFAGDNGLAVGQHGLLGKQNLYDHSLRVPLVICGPGIPKGKRNASLCHLMDIGPTICDLAGSPLTSATDGLSLATALKSGKALAREATFGVYAKVQRALRTRDWKLILYNVNGERHTQLFDLRNDPWEMKSLAGDPRQAKRIAEMRTTLASQLRAAGDPVDWVATAL